MIIPWTRRDAKQRGPPFPNLYPIICCSYVFWAWPTILFPLFILPHAGRTGGIVSSISQLRCALLRYFSLSIHFPWDMKYAIRGRCLANPNQHNITKQLSGGTFANKKFIILHRFFLSKIIQYTTWVLLINEESQIRGNLCLLDTWSRGMQPWSWVMLWTRNHLAHNL